MLNDSKLEFLSSFQTWLENWSTAPYFTHTTQSSSALITTLKSHRTLLTELLNKCGYDFVMTGRLQSDPVQRRFSQYRSMSGCRFLVSLREVNNSERILACRSSLKGGVHFWNEEEEF